MDGHAVPVRDVRVVRTPAAPPPPPGPPVAAPADAAPAVLPRQNRVSVAPPTASSDRYHRVQGGDYPRPVDPRLLDARYEYPFADDASLPCCAPPAPPPPRAATLGKDHVIQGVSVLDEFEDRDPNRINQHLQLLWEDVVAEPDGVRSPDLTWRGSARLFRLTRDVVYACLSCFLGPPVAVVLGAGFAIIAFAYIWCVSPTLRACRVTLGALKTLVRAVTHSTLAPVTEALGYLFANIRVRIHKDGEPESAVSGIPQPLLA